MKLKFLTNIDPRVVYLFVALALALPMIKGVSLKPVRMEAAESFYNTLEALPSNSDKAVMLVLDWGPGTFAENGPQSKITMEHLFRKRIPFILTSIYAQASPTLQELPLEVVSELKKEMPNENWEYGKDWINIGFQAGGWQSIQSLASSEDFHQILKTDVRGIPIAELPMMNKIHTIKDIQMLVQITSLVGTFNAWLQFFRTDKYKPEMLHGCTSITIPEAYLYYSSKQILGFFEGVAGAAWYDELLNKNFPMRKEQAKGINTGLAIAQMVILFFIALGNIGHLLYREKK